MAKWGQKEHRWENYTNIMLFIGSVASIACWHFKYEWLIKFVLIWFIATTLVHFIARIFHRLEKFFYKGALRR
jgi:hypothetical protein